MIMLRGTNVKGSEGIINMFGVKILLKRFIEFHLTYSKERLLEAKPEPHITQQDKFEGKCRAMNSEQFHFPLVRITWWVDERIG